MSTSPPSPCAASTRPGAARASALGAAPPSPPVPLRSARKTPKSGPAPLLAVRCSACFVPWPRPPAMMCLDALPRFRLHPAACKPHGVRLPPWSLGLSSSSCRFYALVSRQHTICNAHSYADDLCEAAPQSPASVRSRLLAAEREKAKIVLSLFLRLKGLRSTLAARIVNKSDGFIEHLVSSLQNTFRSRYVEGRELSPREITDALLPYLEALSSKHGDGLVQLMENFPDPFLTEREEMSSPTSSNKQKAIAQTSTSSNKQKAIAQTSTLTSGVPAPSEFVFFLQKHGMDYGEIKNIVRKLPASASNNVDRTIKPLVELLIELGVPRSTILGIIKKWPQLCGIDVSEKLVPMLDYWENIGINKSHLRKMICLNPGFLMTSRNQAERLVSFLTELGVSKENIVKTVLRDAHLTEYSVEYKLRPAAEYLRSIGADVAAVIKVAPQAFGRSVEEKLKPITEFFLERGFSMEEIRFMVNRFGNIYARSLEESLLPKYEFFLTMEYPRTDLAKFPQYFAFSLEQRIKPRYARMINCGVRLGLMRMLLDTDATFEENLKRKRRRLLKSGATFEKI